MQPPFSTGWVTQAPAIMGPTTCKCELPLLLLPCDGTPPPLAPLSTPQPRQTPFASPSAGPGQLSVQAPAPCAADTSCTWMPLPSRCGGRGWSGGTSRWVQGVQAITR
jgi:hypothetical protein